jgi:glucosylceramidase
MNLVLVSEKEADMKAWRWISILTVMCAGFVVTALAQDPPSPGSLRVFQTARDTPDRLAEKAALSFESVPADAFFDNRITSIWVEPARTYQTIEGFGGAFTESAAVTFYKLSPAKRAAVLEAYFDPVRGNAYTLCRTHINSCDFSTGNYAYDETPGDFELKKFSIERDRKALIPLIREAFRTAGGPLKLFASPWSPPAWMKTNGKMNNGGKLKPECRRVWADYFVRFIREYAKEGIPIWGLTPQNEPEATQTWDSCVFTAEEQRDFIRDYLGPALDRAGLFGVRVIGYDHNRNRLPEWANTILSDPAASRYVWGMGFHWYVSDNFDNVRLVHETFPDKALLFTEGCLGPYDAAKLDDWSMGEAYGKSLVADLNRWTVGWVDWNILLDETGGPNHVGNFCFAPVHADTRTDGLHFMNSYYYIGHFSRFIKPGAVRIASAASVDELETTAFRNPDGSLALVVLNRTGKAVPYAVRLGGRSAKTESPAHSIRTYLF